MLTESAVAVRDVGGRAGEAGSRTERPGDRRYYAVDRGGPGQALGMLLLRCSAPHARHPLDLIYARQAAEICGIEMPQRQAREETEERLGAEMGKEMPLDESQADEAIAARLARLDHGLGRSSGTSSSPWPWTRGTGLRQPDAGHRTGCRAPTISLRSSILLIAATPPAFAPSGPPLSEAASALGGKSLCGCVDPQCDVGQPRGQGCGGCAPPCARPSMLCSLGQRIEGERGPANFTRNWAIPAADRAARALSSSAFMTRRWGPWCAMMSTHGTDRARLGLFEQNANASQTARALYVHRTPQLSLAAASWRSGLDLNDAEAASPSNWPSRCTKPHSRKGLWSAGSQLAASPRVNERPCRSP